MITGGTEAVCVPLTLVYLLLLEKIIVSKRQESAKVRSAEMREPNPWQMPIDWRRR